MNPTFQFLKKTGAVILLISFFLPLSRCENTEGNPFLGEQAQEETAEREKTYDYYYAWEGIRDGEWPGKIVIALAFTWPVIFLFARGRIENRRVDTILLGLEPLIAAGGAFTVYMINLWNEPFIGTYVAFFGYLLFFLGSLREIYLSIKNRHP